MLSEAKFLTIAQQLARLKLEEIKSLPVLENVSLSGDFGDDFPDFFYSIKSEAVPEIDGLFKINVTITSSWSIKPQSFSVTTWLYRKKSQ